MQIKHISVTILPGSLDWLVFKSLFAAGFFKPLWHEIELEPIVYLIN